MKKKIHKCIKREEKLYLSVLNFISKKEINLVISDDSIQRTFQTTDNIKMNQINEPRANNFTGAHSFNAESKFDDFYC